MVIFLSWSGDVSHQVAEALAEFLPNVIQAIEPWLSSADISKGELWDQKLAGKLEACKVGIVCITADNQEAPWLLFEAGALSKVVNESLVCPFVFGIEPTDVRMPLGRFQATRFEETDVKNLLSTINRALPEHLRLSEQRIEHSFAKFWVDFKKRLDDLPPSEVSKPKRTNTDMLEELLHLVRGVDRSVKIGEWAVGLTRQPPPTIPYWARTNPLAYLKAIDELSMKITKEESSEDPQSVNEP